MSDLRKAAEMALEALDFDASTQPEPMWEKERKALRQALAQPKQEPYDQTALELCEKCGWKAIIPGEICLVCARGKQNPVAWISKGGLLELLESGRTEVFRFQDYETTGTTPLYTVPPKREWVGLTDEEEEEVLKGSKNAYDAIKRIGAKLKEKNT